MSHEQVKVFEDNETGLLRHPRFVPLEDLQLR